MKVIIACLLVAVIALAVLMRSQSASIRDLERQVHELNARFLERSKTANLDLQAKCSEQAHQAFAQMGYRERGITNYENHYNPKLNRCFIYVRGMDLRSSPGTVLSFGYVLDAFEGKRYGEYIQPSGKVEEPPWACSVTLVSGETKTCRTLREFSQLVRAYIENN